MKFLILFHSELAKNIHYVQNIAFFYIVQNRRTKPRERNKLNYSKQERKRERQRENGKKENAFFG